MGWRVADSLNVLLAELNAKAPNRSKVSDGSIGDAAHASRSSDHNPWVTDANGVGVVRARDFTHDPDDGLNGDWLASHVAALLGKHPALGSGAYVIWNRRIISTDRLREGWRAYTGPNGHTQHVHVSVGTKGYDSRVPWLAAKGKPVKPPTTGPKQVRLVAANLDFTTGEKADGKHLAHIFDQPALAVIVGVQEAKNIRLAEVAPPGSTAYQKTLTAARRGSGFVARGIKISNFRLFLGGLSKVTEPRWVARGRVHLSGGPLVPFSSHVAPKRAGKAAQDRHLRSLKRRTDKCARRGVAWAVMGDFNRDIEDVARYLNGKVAAAAKGDRIVGVIVSRRVAVLARGVDRYGRQNGLTDHLAPWADVTIKES